VTMPGERALEACTRIAAIEVEDSDGNELDVDEAYDDLRRAIEIAREALGLRDERREGAA